MRRKVDAVQVRMCEVSHSLMSQTKGGNTMEPCRLDGYYRYCGMNKHLWTRKVSLGEFKEMCKYAMTLEHLVAKVCVAAYARLYEGEMLGRMRPEIHIDSNGLTSLYSRSGTLREEVFADVNGDWEVHVNRPDNDSVLWATYTYSTDSIEYYRDGVFMSFIAFACSAGTSLALPYALNADGGGLPYTDAYALSN